MWKNVRIGVKLALGFGLVVVVLATLGILSFVLFASLDRYVTNLTNRSLAAAKNSAQLQRAAFEAIVSEIQYLVDERAETAQATREKLAAALVSLDDIQKAAEQLRDEDLAKRIREVRGALAEFSRSVRRGRGRFQCAQPRHELLPADGSQAPSRRNSAGCGGAGDPPPRERPGGAGRRPRLRERRLGLGRRGHQRRRPRRLERQVDPRGCPVLRHPAGFGRRLDYHPRHRRANRQDAHRAQGRGGQATTRPDWRSTARTRSARWPRP